jgi:beta-glucosidase-like glycosyl hydrolase
MIGSGGKSTDGRTRGGVSGLVIYLLLPAFLLLVAAAVLPGSSSASTAGKPAYLQLRLSFAERAADLVSRMSLDEKALQLSTTNAPAIPRLGIQSYAYWNESQHGVFYLQGNDPTTGQPRWFNRVTAPSFPTNLSASLTWNPKLIHREASAIANEVRGFNDPDLFGEAGSNLGESPDNYGSLFHFNPTVNLQRDPRWGRTDEAFGEDPFLVSRLAGAYLNGFHGRSLKGASGSPYLKAVSNLKHYALNNVEENRTGISSNTGETTIRDYYTAQFRSLIEDFGATGLMSAYNAINGTPAVADTFLLNNLARRSWGFNGYVTSDCGAVATTYRLPDLPIGPGGPLSLSGHNWAPPGWTSDGGGVDARWTESATGTEISGEAGGQAYSLRAGTDLNCAGAGENSALFRSWFGSENDTADIREAIAAGVLSEGVIDRALLRVFILRMKTGEFDPPGRVPFTRIGKEAVNSAAHRSLTQEVAEQALVLLKNEAPSSAESARPLLPADPRGTDRIVVLGDLAAATTLGGYSGTPTERFSPEQGIRQLLESSNPDAEVVFDSGSTSTTSPGPAVLDPETLEAIETADLVVIVAGTDQASNTEGSDRESMEMPPAYRSLIEQAAATGNERIALYLQASGPVSLEGLEPLVPAILYSGPNGQRQGLALAATLFGRSNPSGHLSFTWYRDDSQLPPMDDYDITPEKTGGLGRTYQHFTGQPAYPFGHGLSYSRFVWSKPKIAPSARRSTALRPGGRLPVTLTVRNAGQLSGSDVVQVYATARGTAGGRSLPKKRLVGFARVGGLAPGKSRRVSIRIPLERLSLFDPRLGRDVVYNRRYRFEIARSSADVVSARSLKVAGALPVKVRHVTVQPETLVLRVGQKLNLMSDNRWLADTTRGGYRKAAEGTLEAVRSDQSFVNLSRTRVGFTSNRPLLAGVNRRGVVTARQPGIATITASVGGADGRAVFVVRP